MNVLGRSAPHLLSLASALALGGCVSMSGVGGDSKYACAAPEGVACDSVSGTYANAVANNLPSQRDRQSKEATSQVDAPAPRPTAATRAGLPAADSSSSLAPGSPLRAQARYLRLWIKPWEDIDGDLYDQAHIYVQIDNGRWLIDYLQQRIRDAHAPLRPPPSATAPASTAAPTSLVGEARPPTSQADAPRPAADAFFPPSARLPDYSVEVPR